MEAIKTSVTNSLAESEVKGKAVKKSGKRIGYNYIILKSLKESQKNDVVKCLYIKSLTNFGVCVIKEGTYGDSKDKQGRDIKDRLMWQKQLHEQLQGKVRLPRLLGSFEENGNYYLVLERIRGKSLYKACKEAGKDLREGLITGNKLGMKFLDYMIQLIELLETLHNHQVVHRDVTATNFMITPSGKVAVIDMELSYSLDKNFPDPPFQLGTHGYMSPEQEDTQQPEVKQDVFSVGAIILQIWTGIWPTKLTNDQSDRLDSRVRFLVPDKDFAQIILKCLHSEPGQRSSLNEVKKSIELYKRNIRNGIKPSNSTPRRFNKSEILDVIGNAVKAFSSPLLADKEMGWFSENTNVQLNIDKKKINKAWFASFHKGASGVIYMLSKANSLGIEVSETKLFVEIGLRLIDSRYISRIEETNPGLHFGCAGIASVLSTAILEGLIEPQEDYFRWIDNLLEKENPALGFQTGIAGQGIANLICKPFLHPAKVENRLRSYIERLLQEQQNDGSWLRSKPDTKKNRVTRGFAHGMAGIIYFLLEYDRLYKSNESITAAQKGLEWLIKKAVHKKQTVQWLSSENKKITPWWCEGGVGIAQTFLKAYSIFGNEVYKKYAVKALNFHGENTVNNNFSQCHGLTGLGEVYLDAYQILQQDEWLQKADWIAQFLMHMRKEHRTHGTYWLVENERQPVPDFMIGCGGIVHYLMRFCYPEKVGFPMMA